MDNKIFDKDFFNKLNNINLNLKMKLSNGNSGSRKSKAKGTSVEFSDYREYFFGDDFRRIDWNAFGRFDKFFVKLFMEEREANFNIFIDCSKSMDFGKEKKSILALRLCAIFSYIALNNLDRVTINLMKNAEIFSFQNFFGKVSFQKLLSFLSSINFEGNTDIRSSIMSKDIKNRGVSIVISDFFSSGEILDGLKYLCYKNQELILVHILSREELEPNFNGEIKLIDSESGREKMIHLTPKIITEYNKKLNEFTSKIESYGKKLGGNYIKLGSNDPIDKIIFNDLSKMNILSI